MSRSSPLRHLTTLGALAFLLLTTPTAAQAPDESARTTAQQAGYEGLEAYKQGQYEVALEKLNQAYAAVPAPSLGLWSARAMVQLGRLVEASARYLEVTQLQISGGDRELQREAQAVAGEERAALQSRIPQVQIVIQGAPPGQIAVELDGKALPPPMVGTRVPVDPGKHRATGKLGNRVVITEVNVAEGAAIDLVLSFEAAPPAPTVPAATTPSAPAVPPAPAAVSTTATTPPSPPQPDSTPGKGRAMRTAGWASIGVGAAATAVGGIVGAVVLSKQQALESSDDCVNDGCGPGAYDEVDAYNALRIVSTTGFIVGGVGVATGVSLLLSAPRQTTGGSVSAFVGPTSVGVRGRF